MFVKVYMAAKNLSIYLGVISEVLEVPWPTNTTELYERKLKWRNSLATRSILFEPTIGRDSSLAARFWIIGLSEHLE
jgi:hypothetical protein